MDMVVVYEIARFDGQEDSATLLERMQLVLADGALRVRDTSGSEELCTGHDVASTIGATPALREIRAGQEARITCGPEIEAQLPFVLVPVFADDDYAECLADVNGDSWVAYPSIDGDHVVIPGGDPFAEPGMVTRWAEFQVGQGEWNPLLGNTSIGLLAPGVAIEYAAYDHGGIGGSSAVAIYRFDHFASVFVDWLLHCEALVQLWGGDSSPPLGAAELFSEAATAADRESRWDSDMDVDLDSGEDEEVAESMAYWGNWRFTSRIRMLRRCAASCWRVPIDLSTSRVKLPVEHCVGGCRYNDGLGPFFSRRLLYREVGEMHHRKHLGWAATVPATRGKVRQRRAQTGLQAVRILRCARRSAADCPGRTSRAGRPAPCEPPAMLRSAPRLRS